MEEEKKYSQWEYDEEEEQEIEDPNKDPDATPDPNGNEDPNKNSSLSDDTAVEIEVDGKKETVTLGELRNGYMRQSDYTRKSQEVAELKKQLGTEDGKKVIEKAEEVIDNPENFTAQDVNTAKYLLKIIKGTGIAKEFGLLTREDLEAEKQREKQVAAFSSKLDTAKTEVGKMKGMPAWNEEEIIDFMQESGIHDPMAAYLRKNDAAYRDYIIKQAKGDTSYKSDKGGKRVEPNDKAVNVRTEEGHRSFLADEIAALKNK